MIVTAYSVATPVCTEETNRSIALEIGPKPLHSGTVLIDLVSVVGRDSARVTRTNSERLPVQIRPTVSVHPLVTLKQAETTGCLGTTTHASTIP